MSNGEAGRYPVRDLREVLADFNIRVGATVEGRFIAVSQTEPLFCHECDTEEELKQTVTNTIVSYLETFHHVEGAAVALTEEPLNPVVPIRSVNPTTRLVPSLGGVVNLRQLAVAVG